MAIKSLFCGTFLLTLLSLLSLTQAKREWGLCQAVKSDIPDKIMNVTKMMGIWYEYLITPQLKENQTYSCASWLMMQDQPTDARFAVIYNQFDTNNNDSHIRTFEMNCEPTQYITNTAVCYYQANTPKNLLESYTTDRIKSLRIIYTDYYSYLIARVCQSYGLFYYQDYNNNLYIYIVLQTHRNQCLTIHSVDKRQGSINLSQKANEREVSRVWIRALRF